MKHYQIYIKDTDSLFFSGEAEDIFQAEKLATKNYLDKYPENNGIILELSVIETDID